MVSLLGRFEVPGGAQAIGKEANAWRLARRQYR